MNSRSLWKSIERGIFRWESLSPCVILDLSKHHPEYLKVCFSKLDIRILILFLSENSSKWYFHVVFLIYHLLKRTFEEWFHNGNKVKSKLWITWWIMPCELHDGSYSTLICNPCLDLKSFQWFIFFIPQFQIL